MPKKVVVNKQLINKIIDDPTNWGESVSKTVLTKVLRLFSKNYYNTGKSLVPDSIFDLLKGILLKRDPTNKFLIEVGAPISKDKVKLPFNMPSLDKIKPDTDALEKWLRKYNGPYVLSDKLDGVSGLYEVQEDGTKLYTRGDGAEGQDISHLIPYVIPKTIKDLPVGTTIRGELIIKKSKFNKIADKYANARNAVAGLVNAKHPSMDVAEVTDFVGYAIINPEMSMHKQMKQLEKWKFPGVDYLIKKSVTNDMLSKYLQKRRDGGVYEVDGIVVIDSSKSYKQTKKNPKHGFAFKTILTDQIAEATVLDVEWNVSKDGYIIPRIRIEPVKLVGVVITYATAHNAKFVHDNILGPGALIKLIRSGDVIPYIKKVLQPAASGKPKMPDMSYKWNDSGVHVIVDTDNMSSKQKQSMLIKQLTYFFKKMGVKHISEGIITRMVKNGYDSISAISEADPDEISQIEGIGKKVYNKIKKNLDTAFATTTLYQLMTASGQFGRLFGLRRTKLIVDAYPDLLKWKLNKNQIQEKIEQVAGFDTITASQFAENFSNFIDFYKKLSKFTDLKHLDKIKKSSKKKGNLTNEKIVFTGFRDKELEKFVEDNGGKISSSVSSNTTLVVYIQPPNKPKSSKLKKAEDFGIKLMTKDEFVKKYR